jgi:pimeloyl-ACP methyl ester carboxylesterase
MITVGGLACPTVSHNTTIWKKRLAASPVITVPTITMEGDANGAPHPDEASYRNKFSGKYEYRLIKGGIGHNLPQEAPQAFAQAVIDVDAH